MFLYSYDINMNQNYRCKTTNCTIR